MLRTDRHPTDRIDARTGIERIEDGWNEVLTLRCESVSGAAESFVSGFDPAAPRGFLEVLRPGERFVVSLSADTSARPQTVHWDLGIGALRDVEDSRTQILCAELTALVRLMGSAYSFGRRPSAHLSVGRHRRCFGSRTWQVPVPAATRLGFGIETTGRYASSAVILSLALQPVAPFDRLISLLMRSPHATSVHLSYEPVDLLEADLDRLRRAAMVLHAEPARIHAEGKIAGRYMVDSSTTERLKAQVEAWVAGAACFRLVWELRSEGPLSSTLASSVASVLSADMPRSARLVSPRASTVLDLSNCLPIDAAPLDIVPHAKTLHEAGSRRHFLMTHAMPSGDGIVLGTASDGTATQEIRYGVPDRTRHTYVIGGTGTGKTTLLKNMVQQDIEQGRGVCVIDPHGPLIADLLDTIPRERARDVIVIDPSDGEAPVGLNPLECSGPARSVQINFAVNELVKILDRLYDLRVTGGPMFEQYFRNALLLLMESDIEGATLMDVPLIFEDRTYRRFLKKHCRNPAVERFWSRQAEQVTGDTSLANMAPYVTCKLNQFTANAVLRPMLGQAKPRLDLGDAIDERRIVLVNLSKGAIGELDAQLVGMLLVGKLFTAVLRRRHVDPLSRPPFLLYIDEFQNFVTDTVGQMLAEARKFGLALTLANQTLSQLTSNQGRQSVLDAVLGNCGSLLCFRVGPIDAERLQTYTLPSFSARELQNLPDFHAVTRLLVENRPVAPFAVSTHQRSVCGPLASADALIAASRQRYGRSSKATEAELEHRVKQAEAFRSTDRASDHDNE